MANVRRELSALRSCVFGDSLKYGEIQDVIRECGATIHSMDKVKAGHIVVQEAETQQEEGANMNAPRRRR